MVWNISVGQSSSEIFKDRWWNYEMKSKWKWKHIGPSLESSSYLNVTLRYLGPLDHRSFGRLDLLTLGPLGLLDIRTLGPPPPPPPISSSYLFLLPLPTSSYTGLVWGGMWDNLRWLVSGIEFLHYEISMLFCFILCEDFFTSPDRLLFTWFWRNRRKIG